MNVSLAAAQEAFVRAQVAAGHYASASEVVRAAIRLLEEAEHRRLVEKWIYEDLSEDELALLPEELRERTRAYFQALVDEGLRSAAKDGWVDGPEALAKIRAKLAARRDGAS